MQGLSCILEEVEQLREASSPTDAANGACAIISRKMYEQGDRQVHRDRRNHGEGLGQAGQDLRNDQPFCAELRQENQACPRIEEEEYEKQLNHYVLIQNSIHEADEENLGDLFLDLDGIEEITQAFSSRERSLWRGIREHIQPWEHGRIFTAFVNDRLQWTTDRVNEIRYRQLRRTLPKPTPLPIDAARSGSVGGKHSKGKGARKNANTVLVQGGNRVKKIARASCYPARIRGSKQASDPAQNHGLTSKPAQERSQDTLSRKRSQEQDVTTRSDNAASRQRTR
jgi:hypothetical protein